MKYKFITPVSMQVTEEQFERDLREPLEEMGYTIANKLFSFKKFPFIATNYNDNSTLVKNTNKISAKKEYKRYYIDHYNPKLFLALAAMTDKEYGIKGEWWIRVGKSSKYFTKKKLYKQIESFSGLSLALLDNENSYHSWTNFKLFKNSFRKATKEELINYFKKQETFPIKINKDQAERIINMVCSDWKVKLAEEWGKDLLLYGEVIVFEDLYRKGYKEATQDQRKVLDEIFGKPAKNNPFKDNIRRKDLDCINEKLFTESIIQLSTGAAEAIDRKDLYLKSLYIVPEYEVILHKKNSIEGTVIEIKRK